MYYYRNFIYAFRRNSFANIINIIGLVLAFAFAFVIFTQIDYHLSYNDDIKGYNEIYRYSFVDQVFDDPMDYFSPKMGESMATSSSHIKGFAMVKIAGNEYDYHMGETNDRTVKLTSYSGIGDYLSFFAPDVLFGDIKKLEEPHTVVLPLSMARKIFGKSNPVGEHLYCEDLKEDLLVVGVVADYKDNNFLSKGLFTSTKADSDSNSNYHLFVKIDSPNHMKEISQSMTNQFLKIVGWDRILTDHKVEGCLNRLDRLSLSNDDLMAGRTVSISTWLLICFSIIILIIATINFINFKQAEMPMRLRNFNTQRILGASMIRLRLALVVETVAVALVAYIVACIVVYLMPSMGIQSLVVGSLSLGKWHITLLVFVIATAIGVLCGIYPASFVGHIPPAIALKGNFGLTRRGKFIRMLLISFQFLATIVLLIWIGVMEQQSHFVKTASYGYDRDRIAIGQMKPEWLGHTNAIKNELKQIKGVEVVSYAGAKIGAQDNYFDFSLTDKDGTQLNLSLIFCDNDFINLLGLNILDGYNFHSSDKTQLVITKTTATLNPSLKVGGEFYGYPIVGVSSNCQFHSFRIDDTKKSLGFVVVGNEQNSDDAIAKMKQFSNANIYVKLAQNVNKYQVLEEISKTLSRKFPTKYDVSFTFLNDIIYGENYKSELLFAKQILCFTFLAILISIIGVAGMTMFETEYRRKEIALRKIAGSTIKEILLLFNKRYIAIVTFVFIVAAPIGYILGRYWLMPFAVKVSISPFIFMGSYLIVLLIAVVTVSVRTFIVAIQNPLYSIRTE